MSRPIAVLPEEPDYTVIPLMTVKMKPFSHNYAATNTKGEREYFITNKVCTFVLTIDEKLAFVHHLKQNVTAM
jgi:hypothetical protein